MCLSTIIIVRNHCNVEAQPDNTVTLQIHTTQPSSTDDNRNASRRHKYFRCCLYCICIWLCCVYLQQVCQMNLLMFCLFACFFLKLWCVELSQPPCLQLFQRFLHKSTVLPYFNILNTGATCLLLIQN